MNGTHDETTSTFLGDVNITVDDMGKQMDDYFASHAIDPNALYVLWGGSNDIRNDDSSASVTATIGRVEGLVTRLASAGAKYILVPNLVPIGDIPRYAGTAKGRTANQASAQYRNDLALHLNVLQSTLASQGFTPKIYQVDEWADAVRIYSNGPRFGFINLTNPSQDTSANPDQYIFWDDVHPTTAGHYHLALAAYNTIVNPPPSPSPDSSSPAISRKKFLSAASARRSRTPVSRRPSRIRRSRCSTIAGTRWRRTMTGKNRPTPRRS